MNIIFTIGDCNGIGIEIMLKAIARFDSEIPDSNNYHFSITGCSHTIKNYIERIKLPLPFSDNGILINSRFCEIIECLENTPIEFGQPTKSSGILSAQALNIASEGILSGKYDAVVTMPVSKTALHLSGWNFPGQTEYFANKCNIINPLMLLCSLNLRVALATIHIPISEVPTSLSIPHVAERIKTFNDSLKNDYGIPSPTVAVLGLNPHAGENGAIGKEDMEIISPAIQDSKSKGINAEGPFPADGFFGNENYKNYDGILAMYHDQGLIPLKLLAHGTAVNYTSGLPIIRTSPGHGTAYDIAGKNIADDRATVEAIKLAVQVFESRK